MPVLRYETQILEDGSISLPLLPEYRNRTVVISIDEGRLNTGDNDWPTPTDEQREKMYAVRRFHEIRDSLPPVEITDEEIEQLKHERRMRKMR